MALFLTSHSSILLRNPKPPLLFSTQSPKRSLPFVSISTNPRSSSLRLHSSLTDGIDDLNPFSAKPSETVGSNETQPGEIVDEWGEKGEPEGESSYTKLSITDPTVNDDEWGGGEVGSGEEYDSVPPESGADAAADEKLVNLKRCLVDTFYGTELGFKASAEVRGEVLELVNQLEAMNPTPAPTESPLLDGNWVLLYTAFSELLPLLAVGSLPLVNVKSIYQSIDTRTLTVDNTITLSNPFSTFSFSASASFEVRSPSRIQVQFKEGSFQPPEISSTLPLPNSIDIFGQNIDLSPVQRSLDPLQEAVAYLSKIISGQPPLKVSIPGEKTSSWLITTYLDEDFRISRGDGGLFILAKEGSPVLLP